MSTTTIIILVMLLGYAIISIWIGAFASKQTGAGREEYFVAGGKISPIVAFFTYIATFMSTYAFIGLSTVYYSSGIEWYWFETMEYVIIIVPMTWIVGFRLYKLGKMHNYVTNADLIAHRLGSEGPVRVIVGLIMIFYPSIFYVGIQLIGMSAVISGLTGGEIPYNVILVIFAIIMAVYLILGGFRSVAYTDVFQGITFLLLLVVGVIVVYNHWGGFGQMFQEAGTGPNAWVYERSLPVRYLLSAIVGVAIVWSGLVPHLWTRFYAASGIKSVLATGLSIGLGAAIFYGFMPLLIGTALVAFYPEAPDVAVNEQIVSMMFSDWVGVIPATILMFGLVAAGKSTADSIMLNLSSILQVDILEKTLKVKWSEKQLDLAARLMIIVVLGIAAVAALSPDLPIVQIAVKLIWPGMSVVGVPVILMLFWKRINKYGGLAGFISGFVSLNLFMFVIWPEWPHNPFYLWEGALPVLIGVIFTVVVSLLTPPPPKELLESFYGTSVKK